MTETITPLSKRIAILFVHGQGEQRPMDDVSELARTVWDADPALRRNDGRFATSYVVQDPRLEGADFRRVTTEDGPYHTRVDFFELYWADLMVGNRLGHLTRWFLALQRRPREQVPKSILPVRQFAIRACEAVLLLALLFAFSTALLLPASPSMWGAEDVRMLTGMPLPSPADHAWLGGVAAFVLMLSACLVVVVNEAGGEDIRRLAARWGAALANGLKLLGLASVRQTPVQRLRTNSIVWRRVSFLAVFPVILFLILGVFLVIWMGPTPEWGDMRLPIYVLIILSGALATFDRSQLPASAFVALLAAGLAAVCFFWGDIRGANLLTFDAPKGPLSEKVGSTFHVFGNALGLAPGFGDRPFAAESGEPSALPRPGNLPTLALVLMTLQVFAMAWFVMACWRFTGSQSSRLLRVLLSVGVLFASMAVANALLHNGWADPPFRWIPFSTGAILLVLGLIVGLILAVGVRSFLVPVMADSARYLSRESENVGARQLIRRRGLDLLTRLHAQQRDGSYYERIVVVGHSLGSVVAYELLSDFWSRRIGEMVVAPSGKALTSTEIGKIVDRIAETSTKLREYERVAGEARNQSGHGNRAFEVSEARETLVRQQAEMFSQLSSLASQGSPLDGASSPAKPWLISDFVTIGSPLAHAEFLLAAGPEDLRRRQRARELPTCPASVAAGDDSQSGYVFRDSDGCVRMSHGALFAAVRWTNLYFQTEEFILIGDAVAGEVAGQFGLGIRDVPLDPRETGTVFAHNEYWKSRLTTDELRDAFALEDPPAHLHAFKSALGLELLSNQVRPGYRPELQDTV